MSFIAVGPPERIFSGSSFVFVIERGYAATNRTVEPGEPMAPEMIPPELAQARERFLALVADIRPELHRYCARLTGSVIDGEDIVQEALAKAFYAISLQSELPPLRPWLFRIAHNSAIDFLRRYEHAHVQLMADPPEGAVADDEVDRFAVASALASFVQLPVLQRSAVILKDVLGHSLDEAAATIGTTIPAVKAALVRGRARLRALGAADADAAAPGEAEERALLQRYVGLFHARDWDGLRALLAEECQLDLVARAARRGKGVGVYFERYAGERDLGLVIGRVEGRLALGVRSPATSEQPSYFVFLEWHDGRVTRIRDYRYVPYVAREARFEPLDLDGT
jgi:RNA polymerase sigma-70 factor (ECF subfamily)